jgi:hypothetical protein
MKHHYDFDRENGGMCRDSMGGEGKSERPMLENIISLLQALVNILDIIGENIGKKM